MHKPKNRRTGRPSIRDVARRAGVSPSCVSNVLNRRRSQSDRIGLAVLEAVRALGYRTNPIASNLRRATGRFIGVVIPDFENPFFGQLVAELERCAETSDYRIVAASSREDPAIERREVAEFLGWRVAGLLLAPATGSAAASRPETGGVPLVIVDRFTGTEAVDEVGAANAAAAQEVVERLLAAGHRRILLAFSTEDMPNVAERLEGARTGAAAGGAALVELACGPSVESSAAALEAHFADHAVPPAIFGLNNLATLAAQGAVQRRGLVAGRDLSLVSFDDSAWMAHVHPRVAAVKQPVPEIARVAWACLTERIRGIDTAPRKIRLPCLFEPRDTIRAAAAEPQSA